VEVAGLDPAEHAADCAVGIGFDGAAFVSIDFGIVRMFFPERGFGFVTHEFATGAATDVFFHVKNIQKDRPDLVEYLKGKGTMGSACFWYETENTPKGDQVYRVLEPSNIATVDREAFISLSRRVESILIDINASVPGNRSFEHVY